MCVLPVDTWRAGFIGSNRNSEIYLKGHAGSSEHLLRSGCQFCLMSTSERWLYRYCSNATWQNYQLSLIFFFTDILSLRLVSVDYIRSSVSYISENSLVSSG